MSTRIKAFRYVWNRHEILVGKYSKTKIRRSLTKHFTETFPLIHLYPFRTIIDSNRHKSLLNRWLNSHHPVHCLLLRIKFSCPREMVGPKNRYDLFHHVSHHRLCETRITYSTSCCAREHTPLGSVALWIHRSGSLEFAIYCGRDLSGDSTGLAWLKFYGHSPCIYSSRGQNYSTKDYVNINSRWSHDTRIEYTVLLYSFIAIRGGNRNFESETTLIIG